MFEHSRNNKSARDLDEKYIAVIDLALRSTEIKIEDVAVMFQGSRSGALHILRACHENRVLIRHDHGIRTVWYTITKDQALIQRAKTILERRIKEYDAKRRGKPKRVYTHKEDILPKSTHTRPERNKP